MARNIADCRSCRFLIEHSVPGPYTGKTIPLHFCARYPRGAELPPWKWCGEWQIDTEKTCHAMSPMIPLDLDKGHRVACAMPTGHEGKSHTDGSITWEDPDA